jgi:Na+/H+ antiporter
VTIFELVIGLLLAGAVLTLLAQRIGAPYPALLALGGVVAALVPGMPAVTLDPQLALALFVAPVLLDAGYDASLRDLRDNWVPVGSLVLVAVILTVAAVACVARLVVPAMPWPVAIALGAIVAPPDASAAIAVLRQLSPPHRITVILGGESLLNDATALLIYRLAVAAAVSGHFSPWHALPMLLMTCGGGAALGWGLARAYIRVARLITDIAVRIVIQFLATFAVWILADRLGLSPVITTVVYAATLARTISVRFDAEHRRASYAVWEVAVFVLNALAFVLVGLQIRGILERANGHAGLYLMVAGAVLGAVVLTRIAWVMGYNTAIRWKQRRFGAHTRRPMMQPTVQSGLVVAWCGMRGVVTLAAALALPDGMAGEAAFPDRDLVVAAAFAVVLGTLVLQGLTLRPLLLALKLSDDRFVEREVARARQVTARAALRVLDDGGDEGLVLRQDYEARLQRDAETAPAQPSLRALRRKAIAAERQALVDLRRQDEIGDDAYHRVEEELDWADVNASRSP